jgi:hypothetical protein
MVHLYVKLFSLLVFMVMNRIITGAEETPGLGFLAPSQGCQLSSGNPLMLRLARLGLHKPFLYGYIALDVYGDTRRVLGSKQDHFLFYPAPKESDVNGRDINGHPLFTMTAIETRLGVNIPVPQFSKDIETLAIIEGDFRGSVLETDISVTQYRLRLALGKILWPTGSFLFGQYWHPLFIAECSPGDVSFDSGAPIEPQARSPQIRITQRWGWFEVMGAAVGQTDFANFGPCGVSFQYIRFSAIPNLHLQFRAHFNRHTIGVAGDYKRLVPRVVTNKNFKVSERIDSFITEAFGLFIFPPCSLRAKVVYAQNGTEQGLLSGYAVTSIDPVTDFRRYTNTAAVAAWLDFSYIFHCDRMELGFFVGGTKNLGASEPLFLDPTTGLPMIYDFNSEFVTCVDVDYVARFSPRYVWSKDPLRIGFEIEWTRAAFGKPNKFGRVAHDVPVDNVRILLAFYYLF